MNGWEFLDRTLARLRVEHVAGGGVFLLTAWVLVMIEDKPILADNDLFKMLAQAIVVQGLVGLAMASWFTQNRSREEGPIGTPDDPVSVEGTPDATTPVTVVETKVPTENASTVDSISDPWNK